MAEMTMTAIRRELEYRPSFVYVSTSNLPDLPVKVGCSINPVSRAKAAGSALASAISSSRSGEPFSLAYAEKFDTRTQALAVEDTVIEILQPYLRLDLGLEWFDVSGDRAVEAVKEAADLVGNGKLPSLSRYSLVPRVKRTTRRQAGDAFDLCKKAKATMKRLGITHSVMAGRLGVSVRDIDRVGQAVRSVNLALKVLAELDAMVERGIE